jgi:hypothetical protein
MWSISSRNTAIPWDLTSKPNRRGRIATRRPVHTAPWRVDATSTESFRIRNRCGRALA